MPVSVSQINLWLANGVENQNLEFKEAKENMDFNTLCEYCVAISNEGGGHIVLGVNDKRPRVVVGTAALENVVSASDALFRKLGFRVDIDELFHVDGRVLVLTVPSRPCGTAYNLSGRYLMRSGSSLTAMTEDRLRSIFSEGVPDWLEQITMDGVSFEKVVELLDTQSFFELIKFPYPDSRFGVIEKLKEEKTIDVRGDVASIRRIAAILLAKRIDMFGEIQRKAPRVIVYNDNSKLDVRSDIVGQKGYAVGFQSLVAYVMQQVPQNEIMQNALRVSAKLMPEPSVRELIVNSLIHQDFSITGAGPMIKIFPKRLVISNPRKPIVSTDRFIDGYQSRNERLAQFMRKVFICEERGSGIDRVVSEAELYQLPAPRFEADTIRTTSIVYAQKPFQDMDREDCIRACYQHCV